MSDQLTQHVPDADEDPAIAAARYAVDVTPEEVEAAERRRNEAQPALAPQPPAQAVAAVEKAAHALAPTDDTPVFADTPATRPEVGVVEPVADLDLDEVNTIMIRLGGRMWRAVEPSIATNKILAMSVGGDDDDDQSSAAAVRTLESIYNQVQHILFDVETDRPPSREFVEKHLTGRNFGKLMQRLNDEEGARGNARRG